MMRNIFSWAHWPLVYQPWRAYGFCLHSASCRGWYGLGLHTSPLNERMGCKQGLFLALCPRCAPCGYTSSCGSVRPAKQWDPLTFQGERVLLHDYLQFIPDWESTLIHRGTPLCLMTPRSQLRALPTRPDPSRP